MTCYEYPTQRPSANSTDHAHAYLRSQIFAVSTNTTTTAAPSAAVLRQVGAGEARLTFPPQYALDSWDATNYRMVTDGGVIKLDDGKIAKRYRSLFQVDPLRACVRASASACVRLRGGLACVRAVVRAVCGRAGGCASIGYTLHSSE